MENHGEQIHNMRGYLLVLITDANKAKLIPFVWGFRFKLREVIDKRINRVRIKFVDVIQQKR